MSPTVSIVVADSTLAIGQTSAVTFTFSEAVTGFTNADLTLENGTLSALSSSDGGVTWTATLTPAAGVSDATNVITLDNTGVVNSSSEAGVGTTDSNNYAIDTLAPTVVSVAVPANGVYGTSDPLTFTVTFDEAVVVTGTPQITLTVGSSGTHASYVGGSGTSALTFSYTPLAGQADSDGVTVGAMTLNGGTLRDLAGNDAIPTLNSVGSTTNVLVDAIAPAAPSAPDMTAGSDTGASSTDDVTTLATPTFTGTAETGSTVTLYDTDGVTVLGSSVATDGTWSITSSALTFGSHTLTADAQDAAGNVSPASAGLSITIVNPAPPPPTIPAGTSGPDLIHGDLAANSIDGGAGADSLLGGGGGDTVLGGSGDDLLQGNAGRDSLVGGDGADIIRGGQDGDFLQGAVGRDLLFGDNGVDTLHGGQDADTLQGGEGADLLFGDKGDDIVRGGQGDDQLFGGDGNDFIAGDLGADTLTGGAGADVFYAWGGAGIDRVTDFNAAEGDRVQLPAGASYTLAQAGSDVVISMTGGGQMVLAGVQLSSLSSGWILGA